jgi:hypothetical protein
VTSIAVLESRIAVEWWMVVMTVSVLVTPAVVVPLGLAANVVLFCAVPVLIATLMHWALRRFFSVRFDEAGVTVIRPWARRRVPWEAVHGMHFHRHRAGAEDENEWWKVRLVLADDAPGPVLLALDNLDPQVGGVTPEGDERLIRHGRLFEQFIRRGLGPTGWPEPWPDAEGYVERALRAYERSGP